MIVVSGTRRCGTSMWMQILAAAGYEVIGERFPSDWGETLRAANPYGFYESILRHGIYHRTNPHPITGEYARAQDVQEHAAKVFIPGLVRSERAYLHRTIVSVRPWREYVTSIERLYRLEDEALDREGRPPPRMPPALEWWDENFAVVRDLAVRQYACHVQSYGGVLADPEKIVTTTLRWIGGEVDTRAAIEAVRPPTAVPPSSGTDLDSDVTQVFDDYYDAVDRGRELDRAFIDELNATHTKLAPEINRHRMRIAEARGLIRARPDQPDDSPFVILDGEWA